MNREVVFGFLLSFNTLAWEGNFGAMNSITLDEVLKAMAQTDKEGNPVSFAISAVTCDLTRKRGGERLVYEQAVVCNPGEKKIFHNRNSSLNIKGLGTNQPRAIHPILITEFNGRAVTL